MFTASDKYSNPTTGNSSRRLEISIDTTAIKYLLIEEDVNNNELVQEAAGL
jgi:hypothetical protein